MTFISPTCVPLSTLQGKVGVFFYIYIVLLQYPSSVLLNFWVPIWTKCSTINVPIMKLMYKFIEEDQQSHISLLHSSLVANLSFTSLSHAVKLIADITALIQSSFCPPSSGQSTSTLRTQNLTAHLSFSLVQPTSRPSPPLPFYSGSVQASIFFSTTSVQTSPRGSCPNPCHCWDCDG